MAKGYAVVVGLVLTLVGILGFVLGNKDFMGLHFNLTHNAIHLVSGVIGLAAGLTGGGKGARTYAQVFGVVYLLVGIVGLANLLPSLNETLMLNTRYNAIHLAVGLLGVLAGFMGEKSSS